MSTLIVFAATFLLLLTAVQALQINFNTIKSDSPMLIRDTAQAHYESIIDDILSQHNEGLLTELSFVIKDPHEMQSALRPQAELLVGSSIQDVCVAQMPGMIANQIHELSNMLYTSAESIVSQFWTTTDIEYRQLILNSISKGYWEQDVMDEVVNALEILNMDIADHITATVNHFDILGKVKASLKSCQSVFDQETNAIKQEESESFTEKVWTALLVSFSKVDSDEENIRQESQHGFLNRYILELTSDLQTEMYSRVYELAKGVYEDLAFGA